MAYRLTDVTRRLEFPENPDLNRIDVEVSVDVPLSTFFDIQVMVSSDKPESIRDACLLFGQEILRSWDIQDNDGIDIAPTGSGFMSLPMTIATEIMTSWTTQVASSGKPSPSLNGGSQLAGVATGTGT
jgi:hypothetical protein